MKSENFVTGSQLGGPGSEPSSQGQQHTDRWAPSTPSAASERSEEGLMGAGLCDDVPARLEAPGPDRGDGGGASTAGRGGESERVKFRKIGLYLRAETFARLEHDQHLSGLAQSHFYATALVIGAQVLRSMCSPGGGAPALQVR